MKKINQESAAVIHALAQMAKGNDGHIKLQNNKSYMPVSVEVLTGQFGRWEALSVAHYYTQNGDLMADPEVVYLWDPKHPDRIYPYSWTMHALSIYREFIEFENGEPARFYRKAQKDTAVFTGVWMKNILQQQGLRVNSETVESF